MAQEAGVPTFDARGAPLDRAAALRLIGQAVEELQAEGIEPVGLRLHHARLLRLGEHPGPPEGQAV